MNLSDKVQFLLYVSLKIHNKSIRNICQCERNAKCPTEQPMLLSTNYHGSFTVWRERCASTPY